MKRKQGISLIVLVITIIVMVVLVAAVVVSLSNTGVINRANQAVSDTNSAEVKQIAALAWAEEFMAGKRGETLKADVLEKLKDYTDKYNIKVADTGISVTIKGEKTTVLLDTKYFEYTFDTTNMTATITGVKEQYRLTGYYREYGYSIDRALAIIDDSGNELVDIELPSKVTGEDGNEYTIVAFGETFSGHITAGYEGESKITNIVLPNTITALGFQALYNCIALKSITIPKSVTTLGAWTFTGCTALTDIYYAGSEAEWNALIENFGGSYEIIDVTVHYNYIAE